MSWLRSSWQAGEPHVQASRGLGIAAAFTEERHHSQALLLLSGKGIGGWLPLLLLGRGRLLGSGCHWQGAGVSLILSAE